MAITRTQIAKQLLEKGGRVGLKNGPAGGASAGGNYGGNRNPEQTYGGGDRNPGLEANIDRFAAAEANRELAEEIKSKRTLKDLASNYIKDRQKLGYGLSLSIPGQTKRSSTLQKAFRNFLIKEGKIPPATLTGEEEDLAEFFVEDAFKNEDYGNFLMSEYGLPAVKMRGNVGGLYDTGGDGSSSSILLPETITAQAPSNTEQVAEGDSTDERLFRRFAAEGGSMNPNVVGGKMDFESARQMYGLGKLVKKVTRTVKKIAKSPIGKAAIAGAALQFGGGFLKGKGIMGSLFGTAGNLGYSMPGRGLFTPATKGLFGTLGLTKGGGSLMPTALGGIAASTLGSYFLTPKEEEDEDEDTTYRGESLDIPMIRRNPQGFLAPRFFAEGGSTEKEPVAKKTMPLLDMDGKEMDLRAEGGFVPIGRMEKADDVPARLSKNEFVFTADAVRNAGDGSVDKGAEVMYNMMKNLEAGGEVSEESQGLEGARKMFQTSQRLEEVL